MKIYFSGSIRGGREHAGAYEAFVKLLSNYGEVLSGHIGDVGLPDTGEDGKDIDSVFKRDVKWIKESDVIVADVSVPSVGVGYEIGIAESLKKPILCLYQRDSAKQLSGMIEGNKYLTLYVYSDVGDAVRQLKEHFDHI